MVSAGYEKTKTQVDLPVLAGRKAGFTHRQVWAGTTPTKLSHRGLHSNMPDPMARAHGVSGAEVKKALRVKQALSEMLDQMQ